MSTTAPPRSLRPETFHGPMRQVVFWHLLMNEADAFTARTGIGLAGLWGEIRRGDFHTARAHMDRLLVQEAAR